MIEALDETIKQLLIQKMPLNVNEVDVDFEAPDREWSTAISKPTINIYLHDIRENMELKGNKFEIERRPDGTTVKTKQPGYVDLSYLITVWTQNVEDEHRLLWYTMATLMKYPTLPAEVVQEPLNRQPIPIPTKTAQPDGVLRNMADVWTALDNQLKPVLTYVVTLMMEPSLFFYAPEVRTKFLNFLPPEADIPALVERRSVVNRLDPPKPDTLLRPKISAAHFVQIGGFVTDATTGAPIRGEVVLVEQGMNVRTDAQGRYTLNNVVERPQLTILVVAPGYVTGRKVISIPSKDYDISLEPEPEPAKK